MRGHGKRKVLFGSDYTLFDPGYTLGMIEDADLSAEERALIRCLDRHFPERRRRISTPGAQLHAGGVGMP